MRLIHFARALFMLIFLPAFSFAQYYKPNTKLKIKTRIVSESGTIRGFFVADNDSTIILSLGNRYDDNNLLRIPASNISNLHMRDKRTPNVAIGAGAFVLGFIVTAGLTKNGGDFDNDGKTSFFELLLTAIEGSTSSNRRRRNTALIVGGSGGLLAMVLGIVSNKGFSLHFPIGDRKKFFTDNRISLHEFAY